MITYNELQEHFTYRNGNLYWKKKPNGKGPLIYIGQSAGYLAKDGYIIVGFKGKQYKLHNLIYCYHTGIYPEIVDHKDRDLSNNIIHNLRPATIQQNNYNRSIAKNNTTGVKGVTKTKDGYRMRLSINGKRYSLGVAQTLQEAAKRMKMERDIHHKEFACG